MSSRQLQMEAVNGLGSRNWRVGKEGNVVSPILNEEKSRTVDLDRAESFGFLGFDFRRLRSVKKHVWRAQCCCSPEC